MGTKIVSYNNNTLLHYSDFHSTQSAYVKGGILTTTNVQQLPG